MEFTQIWQFVNSGAMLFLLGFVVKFAMNFTTHGNSIATLEKKSDEAITKAENALAKNNIAELKMERLDGALNTIRETHNGFAGLLDRIETKIDKTEEKIDKLFDKLDDHQRTERKN